MSEPDDLGGFESRLTDRMGRAASGVGGGATLDGVEVAIGRRRRQARRRTVAGASLAAIVLVGSAGLAVAMSNDGEPSQVQTTGEGEAPGTSTAPDPTVVECPDPPLPTDGTVLLVVTLTDAQVAYVRAAGWGTPGEDEGLSQEQIEAVVAYLRALEAEDPAVREQRAAALPDGPVWAVTLEQMRAMRDSGVALTGAQVWWGSSPPGADPLECAGVYAPGDGPVGDEPSVTAPESATTTAPDSEAPVTTTSIDDEGATTTAPLVTAPEHTTTTATEPVTTTLLEPVTTTSMP